MNSAAVLVAVAAAAVAGAALPARAADGPQQVITPRATPSMYDSKGFAAATRKDATRADGKPVDTPAPSACTDCAVVLSVSEAGRGGVPNWRSTIGSAGPSAQRPSAVGVSRSHASPIVGGNEFQSHPAGYQVSVKMDDGTIRSIRTPTRPSVSPGDHVRVAGNMVFMR